MNGWKNLTDLAVTGESIKRIEGYCSELLIHAADVEGLCQGIDEELVKSELSSTCAIHWWADTQASATGSPFPAHTPAAPRSWATSRSSTSCQTAKST